MKPRWMSTLIVLTGVMSALVGLLIAVSRFRAAGRAYRKIGLLSDTMPDGWPAWFFGGFSNLTLGTHCLRAFVTLAVWTAVSLWFIVCGLRLFWHA